jgi:DNA-binding response OmpR family regulator
MPCSIVSQCPENEQSKCSKTSKKKVSMRPMKNTLIMVIDQSKVIQKIVETICTRTGLQCLTFPDGIQAMYWMIEEKRLPDLIFLSNQLPRLNGYAVSTQLKTRFPDLPIIMFLWQPDIYEKLLARLAGANRYLIKPFRGSDIQEALNTFLCAPCKG